MRIHAFQGLRYSAQGNDPATLAAPPFDQIDDQLRDRLQRTQPHHFAHLTKPVPGPEGDVYQHSAALHQQWRGDGTVQRDEEPSLYPYVVDLAGGGQRVGICVLVGVEPESSGVIRPHEKTLDKPFADRLNLLKATRTDYEPVMFLADEPGSMAAMISEDTASDPLVAHTDDAGNVHRLYRVHEPARVQQYQQLLGPCTAAIADGHHRYKVGRTYAEQEGHAGQSTAAGCKMAVLFSMRDEDMVIDPIHRAFAAAQDLDKLRPLAREVRHLEASSGPDIAAAVANAEQPALAVQVYGQGTELWLLDPAKMPAGNPPASERLAVAHLHFHLLPELGMPPEAALDGTTTYRANPDMLYNQVTDGTFTWGVYLPPMSALDFGEAISKGDLLPAKATRFLPKLVSGLVWSGHDGQVA